MKKKINKKTTQVKSFFLRHHANPHKVDSLFDFYHVYKAEYQHHVQRYWKLFLNNQINNNKFSHLGSTKDMGTALNSAYLQICLNQSCSLLNNYLSNLKEKFNAIVYKSSIKDKDQLHQLHAINLQHAWLNKNVVYKPEIIRSVTDDFGNLVFIKYNELRLISESSLKLARKIFKHIIDKEKVKFPSLDKPRLLLDDRVYKLEKSKTKSFDYWLHITTLFKGKRLSIPIKAHDYFNLSQGEVGKTIELDFRTYDYQLRKPKHNSLIKPIKQKQKKGQKYKGYVKVNKEIRFIFNKQVPLQELAKQLGQHISQKYNLDNSNLESNNLDNSKAYDTETNNKSKRTVGIDLGLSTFMATSDGQLMGNNWLTQLKTYDNKIQTLASTRHNLLD